MFLSSKISSNFKRGVRSFSQIVDVFVVGGGVTGGCLSSALSKSDFFAPKDDKKRIVLLEQANVPNLKDFTQSPLDRTPNPRVITLSPGSLSLLSSVGALEKMNHRYITPFKSMLVNENFGHSYIKFSHDSSEKCIFAGV